MRHLYYFLTIGLFSFSLAQECEDGFSSIGNDCYFQADIDVFKNPLEKMSLLKSIIIDELDSYYSMFKNEPCDSSAFLKCRFRHSRIAHDVPNVIPKIVMQF